MEANRLSKERFHDEDPYLIFDFNDDQDGSVPYVMKSSRLKVSILRKLDRDGSHPLAKETVHLDVLHSRTKGWKTYTISYTTGNNGHVTGKLERMLTFLHDNQ